MFGFFDSEKRRKKRALEDFAKMVNAHPVGAGWLKLEKKRFIAQRAGVLRDAGNIEEAEKTVLFLLNEDIELWRDKRDPRDLHFIADTLRLGMMPKKCCEVLNEVWECAASGKYSIDLTWLCIDYGLALHQQGKQSDECLMWFDRALATAPPEGASIVADNTIRARAAYCAYVTCASNRCASYLIPDIFSR
jgi:tetratricopeptide (TPR) repeat protein